MLKFITSKITSNLLSKDLDDNKYARRRSLLNKLRLPPGPKVVFDSTSGLFNVSDQSASIFVARRTRISRQQNGIRNRQSIILEDYIITDKIIKSDDLVIDCGANIGEFSLACISLGANVLAFEPDPIEFAALAKNLKQFSGSKAFNQALWNECTELRLFDRNDSGDTSIFALNDSAMIINVIASRLDNFDDLKAYTGRIKLLKLEAEGAEPEVLEGAIGLLERIDYITADLGGERGIKKDKTIAPVTSFLNDHNFRLIDVRYPRRVCLFENICRRDVS